MGREVQKKGGRRSLPEVLFLQLEPSPGASKSSAPVQNSGMLNAPAQTPPFSAMLTILSSPNWPPTPRAEPPHSEKDCFTNPISKSLLQCRSQGQGLLNGMASLITNLTGPLFNQKALRQPNPAGKSVGHMPPWPSKTPPAGQKHVGFALSQGLELFGRTSRATGAAKAGGGIPALYAHRGRG